MCECAPMRSMRVTSRISEAYKDILIKTACHEEIIESSHLGRVDGCHGDDDEAFEDVDAVEEFVDEIDQTRIVLFLGRGRFVFVWMTCRDITTKAKIKVAMWNHIIIVVN